MCSSDLLQVHIGLQRLAYHKTRYTLGLPIQPYLIRVRIGGRSALTAAKLKGVCPHRYGTKLPHAIHSIIQRHNPSHGGEL